MIFWLSCLVEKGNLEAAVLPRDVSATCHLKLQNPHFHWDLHPLNPILPIATLKFLYILGCYFFRLEVIEGRIPSPINTTRLKTIHAQKEKLHAPPKGKVGKLGLAGCLPITPLFFLLNLPVSSHICWLHVWFRITVFPKVDWYWHPQFIAGQSAVFVPYIHQPSISFVPF